MKNLILFIYYFLVIGIYFLESILTFYILLQLAVVFFLTNSNNIFHKIYAFLSVRIEPIFAYFRRFLPPVGMFDFSALILFFGLAATREIIRILFALLLGES